ncbi:MULTISPECIES: MCE family protein [unclassified Streptomyces]|uniref:MCE family protein n=1 Tax=unclassified Streptomyces TaxID=2593676 RepID=UPI00143CA15D|nr:MCE family protein [Streptomyces sp. NEAU-H3]NJA55553.1 MCE family protein [Streptomyces sp. NEAU-H3]
MKRSTAAGLWGGTGAAAVLALCLTLGIVPVPALGFDGIEDLPLPGGADLGPHPYTVTADMKDVLNLVPRSDVKVNDVTIGRVTAISLADDGWTARVTLRINGDVRLPSGTGARLEQSSLLGEKYVQLVEPEDGGGRLRSGDRIPISRTARDTEVEEVFGALSLLLNGGGVNQLKSITTELNKAVGGRESQVRSTLRRVDTLVTDLDDHRSDITAALDAVNRLSATLAHRKQDVGAVLDDLAPGLKTLEEQRGSLMTMLRSLDRLQDVAVDTIDRSKADMVADLKALAPSLRSLADAGKDLPDSLQVLLTYPFTDEVLNGVHGDYLNAYLHITAADGTTLIPPLAPEDPDDGAGAPGGPTPGGNALRKSAGEPSGKKGATDDGASKGTAPKDTASRGTASRSTASHGAASGSATPEGSGPSGSRSPSAKSPTSPGASPRSPLPLPATTSGGTP